MQEITQEKSLIKQRIMQYLTRNSISAYEFYKKSGVTRGVLTQNNGITEDNIMRFLDYTPDVSPHWLLTGKGNMLSENNNPTATPQGRCTYETQQQDEQNDSTGSSNHAFTQTLIDLLREKDNIIREQAEERGHLKARINELERSRGDYASDATNVIAHAE